MNDVIYVMLTSKVCRILYFSVFVQLQPDYCDWPCRSFHCFPSNLHEPWHVKTIKMSMRPAKTQISLAYARSDQSLMCAQWVAKDPWFLQTGQLPRLIWVFAGRTLTLLVLSCRGSHSNLQCSMFCVVTYIGFCMFLFWPCTCDSNDLYLKSRLLCHMYCLQSRLHLDRLRLLWQAFNILLRRHLLNDMFYKWLFYVPKTI